MAGKGKLTKMKDGIFSLSCLPVLPSCTERVLFVSYLRTRQLPSTGFPTTRCRLDKVCTGTSKLKKRKVTSMHN